MGPALWNVLRPAKHAGKAVRVARPPGPQVAHRLGNAGHARLGARYRAAVKLGSAALAPVTENAPSPHAAMVPLVLQITVIGLTGPASPTPEEPSVLLLKGEGAMKGKLGTPAAASVLASHSRPPNRT